MQAVFFGVSSAVPLLLGLVLLVARAGTMFRTAATILVLIVAVVLFGMARMR